MRIRFTSLKLLVGFMLFSQLLAAQAVGDYQSSGAGSGNWQDVNSWSRWDGASWVTPAPAAPSSTDGVITIQNTHTITVAAGFAQNADQLVVASGGTLVINDVLTLNNGAGTDLQVNNGTLTQVSTIMGAGNIQIDGIYNWNGGTLASATTIGAIGTVNIQAGDKNLNSTLTNSGAITWSASTISLNNGIINNNSSSTFTVTGNNTMAMGGGAGNAFNINAGSSFAKNSAATTTFNIPVTNAGSLSINAGTVNIGTINGSFTNSGTINFTAGTTLTVGGTAATNAFNAGTNLTETGAGTATLNINASTNVNLALNLVADINLNFSAGGGQTLGGSGSLTINGIMTWGAGILDLATNIVAGATLNMNAADKTLSAVLDNDGTINWTSNNVNLFDGTLTNDGTFTASGSGFFSSSGGVNNFNNNGTFTKTSVGTTAIGGVNLTNTGTININLGTLNYTTPAAAFVNTGAIVFAGSSILTHTGGTMTFNPGTTISGTGTLSLQANSTNNVALVLASTITLNIGGAATVHGGTGSYTVNGIMNWTNGTISVAAVNINSGATLNLNTADKTLASVLTNDGTINWSSNAINFSNGTLNNNATFNATGANSFGLAGGVNVINNNATGVFNKSNAGQTTINNVPFNNAGTINISAGTLSNLGATSVFTNTGTINFSGATPVLENITSATFNFNAGTVITGTSTYNNRLSGITNINVPISITNTQMTTGTVQGPGSLTITNTWDWQGTTLDVNTTIASGATATLQLSARNLNADLTNNGTINWIGNDIAMTGSVFTNNGTINDQFTANRLITGAASSIVNNGTINKTSAFSLQTNLGVTFTNNTFGILMGIGTYTFNGGITNTGHIRPGGPVNPGILAMSANAVTANSPTIRIWIRDGSGPGTGHDRLDLATATDLSGSHLVVVENTSAPTGTYRIMTTLAGNFTGTFATVNIPLTYTLVYGATFVDVVKNFASLPVVWGNFTAMAENKQVKINFTTLQEINTSHFNIEYSKDGRQFTTIATLQASGNSSVTTEYRFTHATPDLGANNFYRIQQVDIDNKSKYSVIRSVRFSQGNVVAVLATPNPVRDKLQLSVQEKDIKVILSDLSGRVLRNLKFEPGIHEVNVQNLPRGTYQLTIYQKDLRIDVQQIIKL